MKSKKGNVVSDLLVFMIVIFAFAVTMVLIYWAANSVADAILVAAPQLDRPGVNATEIANSTIGHIKVGYETLKWITYMVIIAYAIGLILSNFLVRVHPVFVIAYILILAIVVIVSVPISNTYEGLMQDPLLGPSFQGFFGQSWIFLHLPYWIFFLGILAGIPLFVNVIRDKQQPGDEFA